MPAEDRAAARTWAWPSAAALLGPLSALDSTLAIALWAASRPTSLPLRRTGVPVGKSEIRRAMAQLSRTEIPALTADQMREVDRLMVEELHIDLVQMMENAGRNLAEVALTRFAPGSVTVLAGPGGNGGGGLVAARHLANRGCPVTVVFSDTDALTPVPVHQADILTRMGLAAAESPRPADVVIDALIGYSLRGTPTGRAAELIGWANEQPRVLALDVPSGLDVTTGVAASVCVSAAATLTLALPKVGLLAAPQVGELYLGDISVPAIVYERIGVHPPHDLFHPAQVVRLDR